MSRQLNPPTRPAFVESLPVYYEKALPAVEPEDFCGTTPVALNSRRYGMSAAGMGGY